MGLARYMGLSSPAMMTILGAVSGSAFIGFGAGLFLSSSVAESGGGSSGEQASMMSATAIRPRSRASPTNRYGNGEFKCQNPSELVVFSSIIISVFNFLSSDFFFWCYVVSLMGVVLFIKEDLNILK